MGGSTGTGVSTGGGVVSGGKLLQGRIGNAGYIGTNQGSAFSTTTALPNPFLL